MGFNVFAALAMHGFETYKKKALVSHKSLQFSKPAKITT